MYYILIENIWFWDDMKEFQSTLYEMSVPFISKDVSDLIFSRSTSINYKDLFYINSRKMCSWNNVPIKSIFKKQQEEKYGCVQLKVGV